MGDGVEIGEESGRGRVVLEAEIKAEGILEMLGEEAVMLEVGGNRM